VPWGRGSFRTSAVIMAYAILRHKSHRSARAITRAGAHIQRSRRVDNADPCGRVRALVAMDEAWASVRRRIGAAMAKPTVRSILAWEMLLSASPEYFRPQGGAAGTWDEERLDSWHPRALSWLIREWGAENLVGVYLHLDESTPHIHALAVPLDPNGLRIRSAPWLQGRDTFVAMQDRHAEAMAPLGLERGIRGSRATHTAIRSWYAQLQAPLPEMPSPEVATPGMMLGSRIREAWAQEETARLRERQREPLACLQTRARSMTEAEKRRREMEATAKFLAHRLEGVQHQLQIHRPMIELATPVPLRDVAALFELRELDERGICVRRNPAGVDEAVDRSGTVVARHGLDLVMQAIGADRLEALTWLSGRTGPQQVRRVAVSYATAQACDECHQAALRALAPRQIHARLERALAGIEVASASRLHCSQRLRRHGFALVKDGTGSVRICDRHSGLIVEATPEIARHVCSRRRGPERP
jgi:hypothetical protein